MGYQHLEIETNKHVATLWLNRPEKLNALSEDMWADLPNAMADLDADNSIRVIVLAGHGGAFSVGIDVNMLVGLHAGGDSQADSNMKVYQTIRRLQESISCFAESPKPVIAAVHGYCLGAGVDLITSCDIRVAAADAVFSVRETKMGLVADVGSMQRLPAIVGSGGTAEMAYTGGDFDATWAKDNGLVNDVYEDHEAMLGAVLQLAKSIAANSPLVTQGIKRVLAAADGQTIDQALEYVAEWNSSFLMSNDLTEAINAFIEKREPDFMGN